MKSDWKQNDEESVGEKGLQRSPFVVLGIKLEKSMSPKHTYLVFACFNKTCAGINNFFLPVTLSEKSWGMRDFIDKLRK